MEAISSSPTKQRAVLAPLDANAMPSTTTTTMSSPAVNKMSMMSSNAAAAAATTTTITTPSALLVSSSPVKEAAGQASTSLSLSQSRKRGAADDDDDEDEENLVRNVMGSPAGKRACIDEDSTRSRSHSPDTSSLFDTSTGDASWATTATDPDLMTAAPAGVPVPITRPRALTREQAREKAEILRLRLGLASYKVRTGQTSIPLAQLQARPLPPCPPQAQSPLRRRANTYSSSHSRIHSMDSTRPTSQHHRHHHQGAHAPATLSQHSSTLSIVSATTVGSMDEGEGSNGEVDAQGESRNDETNQRGRSGSEIRAGDAGPAMLLQPSPLPGGVLISAANQLLLQRNS